jgi:hypothetical protein
MHSILSCTTWGSNSKGAKFPQGKEHARKISGNLRPAPSSPLLSGERRAGNIFSCSVCGYCSLLKMSFDAPKF